jgi:DeoR family transcriptional regulator, glycerol-3-phosphate regulon repressor
MKPPLRRERIVERVRESERVTVGELARWLRSSHETIRRDLSYLAETGRIRKFHGGAALADLHREGPLAARLGEFVREKRSVAAAAAGLFGPGSSLFIDVGSTTLLFADALCARRELTVITNGLDIARKFSDSGVKVFLTGGEYKADTAELVGTLAIEQIGRFFASDAVITVAGLNTRGAMDFQLDEAQIARAMVAQANAVTVIADSSKLGRDALFQVCPLEDIDRLVVDRAPEPALAAALAAARVEVIVAKPTHDNDT